MHSLKCVFSVLACCLPTLVFGASAPTAQTPPQTSAADAQATVVPATIPKLPAIENSVVKVFSMMRYPEPFRPWTKQPPQEVTGSGVVIEGKRILTNAHVVLYASQVQVQANQSGDKISATVEAIAPGIDLAVLKLDEEAFFETHDPVPRASVLPEIKDAVMAYGFPTGGTSLSITKGIVSRIEFTPYNFPVSGLRVQIDAAINPGNSGGPAVAGDKMIGLAFSVLGGAQNIGYIIPNEEIELFLADIADGHYDGKPAMFDETQKMQNPSLRAFLKLEKTVEGAIVRAPYDESPSSLLKKLDVITQIGGTAVDDEGMVKMGNGLRVRFDYLVQKTAIDGKVALTVIRDGKMRLVQLPVSPTRPMLIPDLQGAYPSYFVYGPIVFSPVTAQMVNSINPSSTMGIAFGGNPAITRRGDAPAFEGEELVVIAAPLFPHKLSQGYWPPIGWVVKSVNGTVIKNLRHLVEVLRDAQGDFITFEFHGRGLETFAFPRKETLAATDDILSDNGVRAQGSADVLAIWNAQPAK
jgi:S1-C subfamily serine protease